VIAGKTPIQDNAEALHALCEAFYAARDPNQTEIEVFKEIYAFIVEYVRIAQGFNDAQLAVDLIRRTIADPVPSDARQVIVYGLLQRPVRGDYAGAAKYFHDMVPQLEGEKARGGDTSFASVYLTAIASRERPKRRTPHNLIIKKLNKEQPRITPNKIIEYFDSNHGEREGFVVDQFAGTIKAPDGSILSIRNVKDRLHHIRKRLKSESD